MDVGVVDTLNQAELPRLVPFAHAVYQNRNRAYSPQHGRFFQQDPNTSAMALLEASSHSGRGMGAIALAFDGEGRYGDGFNLYEYLGSNPWGRRDAMGLSWDPFDMVDEYAAENAGSTAAFLTQIGNDAKALAVVAATIASYLPFPYVGNIGDLALYSLGEQTAAAGLAMGLIPGGKLLGKLGSMLGRIGSSAWTVAKKYAISHGLPVLKALGGPVFWLAEKAVSWVRRKHAPIPGVCMIKCFAAGTLIWTAAGQVPIENVHVGDLVLATDEVSGTTSLQPVTGTSVVENAALMEVSIVHSDGQEEILQVTDDHPFWVELSVGEGAANDIPSHNGWRRADALARGDVLRTVDGPAIAQTVDFTQRRTTVYNLAVVGTSTHHAGERGIWAHNCDFHFHHFLPRQHWSTFRRYGFTDLELDELGEAIASDWHRAIHGKYTSTTGAWNDRWANWFASNPHATKGDVLDYLEVLKPEFGLR